LKQNPGTRGDSGLICRAKENLDCKKLCVIGNGWVETSKV